LVHGDRGLGFVVAHRAMSEAISMAKQHGSGWATVRNSRHYGAGAYYAMMALEHDMIGFSYTTGGKLVAAAGGKGRFMGVNVIALAAPGRKYGPFVLDMACSVVAGGKMELAVMHGGKVPEGFAIDGNGRPLTDANLFWKDQSATLLPLGGTISHGAYKGFGLALIVEILAGFLSGSGGTVVSGADGPSHFFGALRIDAFPSGKDFKSIMDEAVERIKAAPPIEGNKEVMYPGERENRMYQERLKSGIPLHPDVIASLKTMCQEIGMSFDLM
jgi:LDH2 family malate/lactate/ureidoglycolate dehydrogenase